MERQRLTITMTEEAGRAVLVCVGQILVTTQAQLREALDGLTGRCRHVVVDLGQVDLVDASGLAVLATTAEAFDSVVVRRPNPEAREALARTGLDTIVRVLPDGPG